MHTALLGNGILALATAFRLARSAAPGDRISLVGRGERTGSATLAAAAMLNSFAEIEVGSLDAELDRYRFDLSREAGRMWPEFEAEIAAAADAAAPPRELALGTFVVNNTAADDLDDENFEAILAAARHYGEPVEQVSPRDIPNYAPAQRQRATRALLLPNEGWFNPRRVVALLDEALARHPQVEFLDVDATRLHSDGARLTGVELGDGRRLEADRYLLATGAATTDLLRASGLGLPVQRVFYGVGVSLQLNCPDHVHRNCVRTPNRGLACGVYSAPYHQGPDAPNPHVLVGASNFISPVPYAYGRLTSVTTLMQAAIEQINRHFYRADLVRVNVGWRPTSTDTYPLVGRTSLANLVIATGTKRDGIHLAPLLSRRIAAMLRDEPEEDARFAVFAPERAPIRSLTRQQAVDKAVRHQVSAAYQHGFEPAHNRMPDQVERMFRDDVERVHDAAGAHDWGIPPEMLDMYRYGHAGTA